MKHRITIGKAAACLAVVFSPLAGCNNDDLTDLNINPNAVQEINANFLFTAAELATACNGSAGDNWYTNWRTNVGTAAYAIQQLATATGGISQGDKYFENQEASQGVWDYFYNDQLKNIAEVLRVTGEGGFEEGRRKNTREAARILRVANFHRLTDWFGNIPYSEANKGVDKIFFPAYDNQQFIYTDMLNELEEACAAISASNPDDGFSSSDMIYQGDISQWKKYGYSLMLRLAMRVSNVDPTMAAEYVTKAVAGGVFTSNDDNAVIPMENNLLWNNQNGLSRAFVDGGQPTILSKRLIDELKGDPATVLDDDPRLMIISGGINGNVDPLDQEGMPNGLDAGTLDEYTGINGTVASNVFSSFNPKFIDRDEPYMMMNHAEVELLMAEAIIRGIGTVPGTAEAHYAAGVRSAMQMYVINDASFTVSDAAVTAYLAAHPFVGTDEARLEMIGTQLWISKFMNWWEAWSDWRRSGYPTLVPIDYPGNLTDGQIPRRLRMPTSELTRNTENYNAGTTQPDTQIGRVWWDVP